MEGSPVRSDTPRRTCRPGSFPGVALPPASAVPPVSLAGVGAHKPALPPGQPPSPFFLFQKRRGGGEAPAPLGTKPPPGTRPPPATLAPAQPEQARGTKPDSQG